MISVEMLPAAHGDSIWIEYGSESQVHRILIDGGPAHTYERGLRKRIMDLPEGQRRLDLMVVSHIDADHIDGALILLQELDKLEITIDELWFNGWFQLPKVDRSRAVFAPLQGEFLGGLIKVNLDLESAWNRTFEHNEGKAVVVPEADPQDEFAPGDDARPLPEVPLDGDAKLILLGPAMRDLDRLRKRWVSAIRDFTPGDTEEALRRLNQRRQYRAPEPPAAFGPPSFGEDRSAANGASISFVFEHDGRSILLSGDAHARTLTTSLELLAIQRGEQRLRFDAIKLPHHGSMRNVSMDWLQLVDCDRWLISTNGDVFDHPDLETAQLIAKSCPRRPTMLCNYYSPSTERLAPEGKKVPWETLFPEGETESPAGGLRLIL